MKNQVIKFLVREEIRLQKGLEFIPMTDTRKNYINEQIATIQTILNNLKGE